jgi:hypothetical protein
VARGRRIAATHVGLDRHPRIAACAALTACATPGGAVSASVLSAWPLGAAVTLKVRIVTRVVSESARMLPSTGISLQQIFLATQFFDTCLNLNSMSFEPSVRVASDVMQELFKTGFLLSQFEAK